MAITNIEKFALKHGLILEKKGEVGFGRPCVGFLAKGGNYLDYNATTRPDYEYAFPYDERLDAGVKDGYRKHDCMAVLVRDNDYDSALEQLSAWVDHLNQFEVVVKEYKTGATGLQAMFSGITGYTLVIEETTP